MDEQELRSLVREAIERHLGRPEPEMRSAPVVRSAGPQAGPSSSGHPHASHILMKVVPGSDTDDGQCVIEPAVRCNHCGFCQSYGH
jgi:hypothetical protein